MHKAVPTWDDTETISFVGIFKLNYDLTTDVRVQLQVMVNWFYKSVSSVRVSSRGCHGRWKENEHAGVLSQIRHRFLLFIDICSLAYNS